VVDPSSVQYWFRVSGAKRLETTQGSHLATYMTPRKDQHLHAWRLYPCKYTVASRVGVAQMVEQEPLHGKGPNMPAEKTKPMVRAHPLTT
jgi:hypothetical protein